MHEALTEAMLEREERLDRYRQGVEQQLAGRLVIEGEDDFARFFAHVESSFDRGEDPAECARGWLTAMGT